MKRFLLIIAAIWQCSNLYCAYGSSTFSLAGYTSGIQSAMFQNLENQWILQTQIHNRLNFKWIPSSRLNFIAEFRNRDIVGNVGPNDPNSASSVNVDKGFVDLSQNVSYGRSYVLNMSVERLAASYETGKVRVTIGRQRINWAQTLVWNPNDIFNTYSFFDFDYIERQGSDAVRIQYFNTEVSSVDWAAKVDGNKRLTTALKYGFTASGFDVQLLGGVFSSSDIVAGGAWSGAIGNITFRGEVSCFIPFKKTSKRLLLSSLSIDYTFNNNLTFLTEYLFNSNNGSFGNTFQSFYAAPKTVKEMSFLRHSLVTQVNYPITPIIGSSLACMFLPGVKGYYVSPGLTVSVAQNVDGAVLFQSFGGSLKGSMHRFNIMYARIKYSF